MNCQQTLSKKNTENNNKLYTSIEELKSFENLDALVTKYNNKLYYKHREIRKMIIEGKNIFIKGYEDDTIFILNKLNELTKEGIIGYKNSFL